MFFRKKKKVDSPSPSLNVKKDPIKIYRYFGGVVIVREDNGHLSSKITEEGREKFSKMTFKDLLLYFSAIIDADQLMNLYNIYGVGPVSLSRDYFAFRVLTRSILYLLQDKNSHD
jgi:hypothetical protein